MTFQQKSERVIFFHLLTGLALKPEGRESKHRGGNTETKTL